nr:MAG TPA: Formyl transferase [Caudoviricetes sp.]
MELNKTWYVMFSHTGKEIEAVSERLGRKPTVIYTNNFEYNGSLLPRVWFGSHGSILESSVGTLQPNSVMTLHGYNRILPKWYVEYLKAHNIKCYNLHPAPIQLYKDLKGKDPQERLFKGIQDGQYKYIGNVIHEVVSEVDSGEILAWDLMGVDCSTPICKSVESLSKSLHDAATYLWVEFLREVLSNG